MNARVEPATALQRTRAAAGALSTVARQLRFSKARRSKMFEAAGLRPRLVDRLFRLAFMVLVVLVLVVPNAVALVYFGLVASDRFESETRFTVRTSEPLRTNDALAEASGIPSALIVQDTQIIANHVVSRAMLDRIARDIDLHEVFGRQDVDWHARLPADATAEDVLDYWEDMASVSIAPASGIITIKIQAFSAAEAHALNEIVVAASEELVNDMNERIWRDVTGAAAGEVELATAQLSAARINLQEARNRAGILTIDSASSSLSALLTQVQGEKIALEYEFQSRREMVSEDAPQMRVLANQIEAKDRQIADLRRQIASTGSVGGNLADQSTIFTQLEMEQALAEARVAASITALEQLQYVSQQKLLYLSPFLEPTMPDDARYPRRLLWITLFLGASLAAFAVLSALLSVARTRFD